MDANGFAELARWRTYSEPGNARTVNCEDQQLPYRMHGITSRGIALDVVDGPPRRSYIIASEDGCPWLARVQRLVRCGRHSKRTMGSTVATDA